MNILLFKNINIIQIFVYCLFISSCVESDSNLRQVGLSSVQESNATISSIDIIDGQISVQTSNTESIKSVSVINHSTGEDIVIFGSNNLDQEISLAIEQLAVNSSDKIHIILETNTENVSFEVTTNKTGDKFLSVSVVKLPDNKINNTPNNSSGDNLDTVPPSITMSAASVAHVRNGVSTNYTVTYSGASSVTLTNDNIELATTGDAACSHNVTGSGTVSRTVTLSACTGNGTVGISIAAGTASDQAGNTASNAGTSSTFIVDNIIPNVSIGAPSMTDAGPTDTVTYTLTYEVAPSPALVAGDIAIGGTDTSDCSVSGIENAATTSPIVSISGCTGYGTVNISVLAGNSSDAAGNPDIGAGPSTTFNINNSAMRVTFRAGDVLYGDGDNSITLPFKDGHTYNATVKWGDGNSSVITSWDDPDATHTYASPGDYTVSISGTATAWSFANGGDGEKLLSVDQLGDLAWTDFGYAFAGCTNLNSFTTGTTDTSAVTDMIGMFYNASSITALDLSNFNTSNTNDMSFMFYQASSLSSLDLTSFNTSQVTDMSAMFWEASSLTSLDLSSFNTSNVTDMNHMFHKAGSITSLALSDNFTTTNVTNMSYMFNEASSLTSLDLSSFNTSNVNTMANMFNGTSALSSLDISSFNTSSVTEMSAMFKGTGLSTLNLSNFDTSNVNTMAHMFSSISALTSLNTSSFNTSNVTDFSQMFDSYPLSSINVSNFDTSSATSMSAMFYNSKITSIDLSGFNTSNVDHMAFMFYQADSLTSLDLSSFDTSKVIVMSGMFKEATSLTSLDLSNFDIGLVTDMSDMFSGATSLTSINLTNWDTSWLIDPANVLEASYQSWNSDITATIYCNDPDNGGIGAAGTGTVLGEDCN